MNRAELEALLYRMAVTYPASRVGGPDEAAARVAEWLDSDVARFPVTTAFAAFRGWKDTQDRPPTPASFAAACRRAAAAEARALPAPPDDEYEPVPAEAGLEHLARLRTTLEAMNAARRLDDAPRGRRRRRRNTTT